MSLVGGALAQISSSCKAIDFDTTTDVLSADCVPRNQSGYISSHLNLNDCFGYDGAKITPTHHGDFGASCTGCDLYIAPDPFYGGPIYWMNCTCAGQSAEVAVPIEDAYAHQYVVNSDGHLTC
ncbi:hypothetical protein LMH87_009249 [Akanthomyces muscarius]|uniref:Cyanovirin-N domain-containing protein n=1 Tax=Akanthomyces muscarius TaxID=2231603 RepID=A0A9W8UM26_AKAMU|nr:hypothetical protein LMH87_009249 [Akanthomyces muscarius]KAJ4152726.1 hypothetical protein LMH87_009249 [Akanthomyces muscarius]